MDANLERHREAVARAAGEQVDLLVFPELSLTGYRLKDAVPEVARRRDGKTFAELAALSSQVTLLVGLVEESPEHHFYNTAALFDGGRLLAVHRKVYLPTYGMFDEQRYFARGKRVRAVDSRHGRLAVLLCEDMLHSSAALIAALDGAAFILVPSASPARGIVGDGQLDANGRHWEAYNRVMARNLGAYVVYANRVGVEDGYTFWGGSEIVGPQGETLAKAAYYDEDWIVAVLPEEAVRRRRIQNPILRDEDIDLTINELMRLRQRPRERASDERSRRGARSAAKQRSASGEQQSGRGGGTAGPPPRYRPMAGETRPRPVEAEQALGDDGDE